ncbi:serine--tRNA ligase, mitochondrial-like isoform X2 [Daphnia pulicaria]|uniref:serine--tRNA ligase, mitochondrial-like isoform X2 n=1 Tax=Daphnia pulicaria TaxID=35523 RepID=UPI001EEC2631|nr:serine--tRNA ligase, mitochondrial-like isoform X2 [Daphnia pulicaria]
MSLRCLLCFKKTMIRPSMSRNVQLGKLCSRIKLCSSQFRQFTSQSWEPVPDFDYLSDPKNYQTIESNIKSRKGTGSIELFMELLSKFNSSQSADKMELRKTLLAEALKIPNNSHPRLHAYGDTPHVVETPDLLHSRLIESCGMDTKSERTQVYKLEPKFYGDICLSGTAEMALASYFTGSAVPVSELPIKMAAVSRCYRAETSNVQEERGIYRVHQFTKVEMFGVTSGEAAASDALLEEFVAIQKELFSSLGLHYQLLDMPLHELGAPAYRKFDIEAWMPGRNMYGEISSASNCTDYQARRLNIQSIDSSDTRRFVHTVNGTACAVPRTLIALLETHQQSNGEVIIPAVLQPYLNGMERLRNPTQPFKMKWIKSKAQKNKTS